MDWFSNLIFGGGIAHIVLTISLVITMGILLGKLRVAGISLGITWILFVGIILSSFGMTVEHNVLHFIKEFGLILFVFSIGLQVGPSFFSSFKQGGMTLVGCATAIVFLGVGTTYVIHVVTGTPIPTMVGVLSGAVTNTPGLGAAQQAYSDALVVMQDSAAMQAAQQFVELKQAALAASSSVDSLASAASALPDSVAYVQAAREAVVASMDSSNNIALGYAVAYPLGVVGIILSMIIVRFVLRVKFEKEDEELNRLSNANKEASIISVAFDNKQLDGRKLLEMRKLIDRPFVISRVMHNNEVVMADATTQVYVGDRLWVVCNEPDCEAIIAFFGHQIEMSDEDWGNIPDGELVSRRILITKTSINGKKFADLRLRTRFGINITRINRAGMDLIPYQGLELQVGDRVMVVGPKESIDKVSDLLGNSLKKLNQPNLVTIFVGLALGMLLGSLPLLHVPQAVKLGLAGGPLIIAILIGRFGTHFHLVTYTTMSANLMLREIGIALFLAAVGLGAGEGFVDAIVGGGYKWIGYGFIITMVPLLIVGFVARIWLKMNYYTLMGLMSGAMTDPPALAYANGTAGNDMPAVGYSTVYPVVMFLRVLTAQIFILFALG